MKNKFLFLFLFSLYANLNAQNIGNFISVEPSGQSSNFIIPSTHIFQKIIEEGDVLLQGGTLPGNNDFTGYVPIAGSSENGYLSINSELTLGGVSILNINYNLTTKLWEVTDSKAIDFSTVAGTARNCSGTVTPWNTIISCEEAISTSDANNDNRNDLGWCVEIDPANKTVIDKRWALGNFKHENIVVHSNERTVYEGADSNPGYLYKFVAHTAQDLSDGILYVYNGSKNGPGNWIQINNTTPSQQNSTLSQSEAVNATGFNGIEDVEIGPDGMVYFAVKGENRVYRFQDSDPITGTTVSNMETFVGNTSYDIEHVNGTTSVSWGGGNDNLAFDGNGNLWVLQDGGNDYIWVVENGHTPSNPKVKIFGTTPSGSEPTGITFSPDYRFLFMSIQHPSNGNNSTSQTDAAGNPINFDNDISIVIALNENLGEILSNTNFNLGEKSSIYPNPSDGKYTVNLGKTMSDVNIEIFNPYGQLILREKFSASNEYTFNISNQASGVYFIKIKSGNKLLDINKLIKK
jgi:secreted PhoX family phosphatase